MSGESVVTAETRFAEGADGVRYAYRRFGRAASETPPIVFLQHFRGNLDNWDPALVDRIAEEREVILFDNRGVGSSSGVTPSSIGKMARDALAFMESVGVVRADLFGFSIGGFVAQEISLIRPAAVCHLVLAGTGPKGAPGMHGWRQDIADQALADEPSAEHLLYIFYAHSKSSQAAGGEAVKRLFQRQRDRDEQTSLQTRDAQYDAVVEWGIPDFGALQRLTGIRQPTLVLQGDNDLMIPTHGSHTLAGLIPDARLALYADASHGSIFQHAQAAADATLSFLGTGCPVPQNKE